MKDPIETIHRHWNKTPVPVEEIVNDLNFTIQRISLDSHISGLIKRCHNSFLLVINSRTSHERQRFTAAHQLCHLIYHRDLISESVGDNLHYRQDDTGHYSPKLSVAHERQANIFAANILMPRHRLISEKNEDLGKLAAKYQVTERVMAIRLGL